jgi:hypothetical protein
LVDIATALASAVAPGAVRFARSISVNRYNEFIAIYTQAFNEFLQSTLHKCSNIKTLLNQEASVPLQNIYANCRLSYEGSTFEDTNVLGNLKDGPNHMAVTGLAGSGKSMLMRWLATSLIESLANHQRIPLFVEIRDLDLERSQPYELDELIFNYCSNPVSRTNIDQFRIGLREGMFVVLLDGVDEVPPERIEGFLRALSRFIGVYNKCAVVASARPGTQLTNIYDLYVYKVEPLTFEKVVEILEKAPYDQKRKSLLISALKGGLYKTHQSFLSNPLLVTITLITFDDASRIPDNLTGFYAAAFDALFTKHDWSKGIFTRKRYSNLEKSDFERVFQYLCYQSYFKSTYSFTHDEITNLIQTSAEMAAVSVDADAYLKDCVVSVCLLVVEEPRFTFVHRSFQEFFTAKFASGYIGEQAAALLDWLASRSGTDNTFVMTAQLNRELVIRYWGLPKAREVRDKFVQWLENRLPFEILDYGGLDEVICDLRSGDVIAFRGKRTDGEQLLGAISALTDRAAMTGRFPSICALSAYGDKEFSELDGALQKFLRGVLDDSQRVHLRLRRARGVSAIVEFAWNLARARVESLEQIIAHFEAFLRRRDEIASLVRVSPSR